MNKILNLCLIVGILFLFVGAVSATDMKNIKVPDGWSKVDNDGFWKGPKEGMQLAVVEGNDSSWFENNTDGYIYSDTDSGAYTYIDTGMNEYGIFEVVEDGGKLYVVCMSDEYDHYGSNMDGLIEDFYEMNSLNNFNPA